MSKLAILKKVFLGISFILSGAFMLALANQLAPAKIELPPPPIKLNVGCFVEGQPIFMGEVLGPIKITPKGEIKFYSLEWNSTVTLINVACMTIESRLEVPAVKKSTDPPDHHKNEVI